MLVARTRKVKVIFCPVLPDIPDSVAFDVCWTVNHCDN